MSGARAVPRALAAAALLVLLAMAAPAVQAAPFALELGATLATPVPIAALDPRGGTNGPTEPCRTTYFAPDAADHSFTFAEGPDTNGCLRVVHAFTVPDGVRRIGVGFVADRVLDDSSQAVNVGSFAFEQEVRLRSGEASVASSPYFDAMQEERPAQPFAIRFDVPAGSRDVEVEWWFANRAQAAAANDPSAGRLQAWRATVSAPTLVFEDIPLPAPSLREARGQFDGGAYLTGFTTTITVPSQYRAAAAAGDLALHLRMPSSALVDRLLTSTGADLRDDDYETSIAGSTRLVTIPDTTLARLGPGPYTVRFQGTEPVHVEPSMAVLTGAAMLMPPVAIVFAARQLRRRSLDTYIEATDALEGELAPR